MRRSLGTLLCVITTAVMLGWVGVCTHPAVAAVAVAAILIGGLIGWVVTSTSTGCLLGAIYGFNGALLTATVPFLFEAVQYFMFYESGLYTLQTLSALAGAASGGCLGGRLAISKMDSAEKAPGLLRWKIALAMIPTFCVPVWFWVGNVDLRVCVSNQSKDSDPMELEVLLDGQQCVLGRFPFIDGHEWQQFCLVVKPGRHRIVARSTDGKVEIEESLLVLYPRQLVIVTYWFYSAGHGYDPGTPGIHLFTLRTALLIA